MYPHVVLSSPNPWNPQTMNFPSYSESEMAMIEARNVSMVESKSEIEVVNSFQEGFEVDDFNDILLQSLEKRQIGQVTAQGPLKEQELKPPRTFISKKRHSSVTAEDLSDRWCISVKQAQLTLDATSRRLIRSPCVLNRIRASFRSPWSFGTRLACGRPLLRFPGLKYWPIACCAGVSVGSLRA